MTRGSSSGPTETDVALLCGLLRELGLPETLASTLLGHAMAVERDTARLGLVSARDSGTVVRRHTADALLFALAVRPEPGEHWMDVGSGAGFPGIPLACCYAQTSFTLVEPLRKRAGFLELCAASLGLGNVRVVPERIETVTEEFDVAVTRAFTEPAAALRLLLARVRVGGAAIVAAGASAVPPEGATEVVVARPGVDSPGRLFLARREPTTDAHG